MKSKIYTEDQFIDAVRLSYSIASVLRMVGLRPVGGNYDVAHRKIKELNLDTSHFTGSGHLKGKTHGWAKKTPLCDVLIKEFNGGISTHKLKLRLIREGLLQRKCYRCGINEWFGKQLSLELEHKNGDRHDNRIENLEILCPNCHSLTSTYRGKGIKNRHSKLNIEKKNSGKKAIVINISDNELKNLVTEKSIIDVGKILNISPKTVMRICSSKNIKIPHKSHLMKKFNVSKEELENLINENPMTRIAKIFGVSDTAIKKRCLSMNIELPKNRRGYWQKMKVNK